MQTESSSFTCEGINIRYVDQGTGRPLLFVHGFGASSFAWRYVAPSFTDQYRVILIDLMGFGFSEKPTNVGYSISDQSRILTQFIKHKNLQDVVLIGHSFGGAVAIASFFELQKAASPAVSSMILISTACYPQQLPLFLKLLRIPLLNRLSFAVVPTTAAVWLILNEAFFDRSKISEEMVKTYGQYFRLKGYSNALIATAAEILPKNLKEVTSRYSEINVPVLVLWGEHDKVVPPENGKRLAAEIAKAELVTITRCGHIPHEECPEETARLIQNFLEK